MPRYANTVLNAGADAAVDLLDSGAGAGGTAEILVRLRSSETALLTPHQGYGYGLVVQLSDGRKRTLEAGIVRARPAVRQDV